MQCLFHLLSRCRSSDSLNIFSLCALNTVTVLIILCEYYIFCFVAVFLKMFQKLRCDFSFNLYIMFSELFFSTFYLFIFCFGLLHSICIFVLAFLAFYNKIHLPIIFTSYICFVSMQACCTAWSPHLPILPCGTIGEDFMLRPSALFSSAFLPSGSTKNVSIVEVHELVKRSLSSSGGH